MIEEVGLGFFCSECGTGMILEKLGDFEEQCPCCDMKYNVEVRLEVVTTAYRAE